MKIVIIGGGVSGLSAGIYARLAGFESVIYEKSSVPGGFCASWDRQGYHIDGCVHWLTGTKEGNGLYSMWRDLGVVHDDNILHLETFGSYDYMGYSFSLWRDLDKLEKEWTALFPEDEKAIKTMVREIRQMAAMTVALPVGRPREQLGISDTLRLLKGLLGSGGVFRMSCKTSGEEYAKRFKNPALQKIIRSRIPGTFSILAFLFGMANFASGNGGFPKGGSRGIVESLEKRYADLGGVLHTGTAVEEIIISGNRAAGIRIAASGGSQEIYGDYVIAACDPMITFKTLLKNKYTDKHFEKRYRDPAAYPVLTTFQAAFGIALNLALPPTLTIGAEPFRAGKRDIDMFRIHSYSHESSFAPPGHTVITVPLDQEKEDYLFWENLYKNDNAAYRREKERIAKDVQARLEKHFPQWQGKIQLLDAATPVTYTRYAGAYQGGWMAFMMTPKGKLMMHNGKVRGLKNFYLAGQWLQPPGGLPTAAMYGKFAVQRICGELGREFQIEVPAGN